MNKYPLHLLWWAISAGDLGSAIVLLFKIIRQKIFGHCYLVFMMTASDLERAPQIKIPGYQCKEIHSHEMIDQMLKDRLADYKNEIWWDMESMIGKKGTRVWIGYLDSQLVHIARTTGGDQVKFFFPMFSDAEYISNCITLREYRGLGLYSATLIQIEHILAGRGVKRFYVEVLDWNVASIAGIKRAGFQFIGRGILKRNRKRIWFPIV